MPLPLRQYGKLLLETTGFPDHLEHFHISLGVVQVGTELEFHALPVTLFYRGLLFDRNPEGYDGSLQAKARIIPDGELDYIRCDGLWAMLIEFNLVLRELHFFHVSVALTRALVTVPVLLLL